MGNSKFHFPAFSMLRVLGNKTHGFLWGQTLSAYHSQFTDMKFILLLTDLTLIFTAERATIPCLLRASQEYSPLSPSTTFPGLDTKFCKHSPFGRVTPKMYSPAPVFTRQKLYAQQPPSCRRIAGGN